MGTLYGYSPPFRWQLTPIIFALNTQRSNDILSVVLPGIDRGRNTNLVHKGRWKGRNRAGCFVSA